MSKHALIAKVSQSLAKEEKVTINVIFVMRNFSALFLLRFKTGGIP
jgi:hypothetical protein